MAACHLSDYLRQHFSSAPSGRFKLMRAMAKGDLAGLGMPGGPMLKTKKSGYMEKKDRNKKKRR